MQPSQPGQAVKTEALRQPVAQPQHLTDFWTVCGISAQPQSGCGVAGEAGLPIPEGRSQSQLVMWTHQSQTVPVMTQPAAHPVDPVVQYFVPGTSDVATTQVRRNLMGAFADNGYAQPQPTSGGAVKDNRDGRSVDDVTCRTLPGTEYTATGRRSQSARRTAAAAEEEPEGW